ncbi:hypothetical protein pdam_00011373 [Pocillopora damicornis]|uniref:Uncharacterized protein n=1 Tax=Pocillopora damicornis TaxID=46731 RepID=A0A3M6UCL8_POCDA|nr:hypothetical protein pdam_00011373 [Pocillopora damicornis]
MAAGFSVSGRLMEDKKHLPSEIISDLLPVKTEKKESEYYNEQWTGNEEKRKMTCWPTKDERDLALTLIKCINENSRMRLKAQRKLQLMNFNCTLGHSTWLSEAINNCQLRTLNLIRNNISDIGAQHLAEAINNKCQLRTLNLSLNENITKAEDIEGQNKLLIKQKKTDNGNREELFRTLGKRPITRDWKNNIQSSLGTPIMKLILNPVKAPTPVFPSREDKSEDEQPIEHALDEDEDVDENVSNLVFIQDLHQIIENILPLNLECRFCQTKLFRTDTHSSSTPCVRVVRVNLNTSSSSRPSMREQVKPFFPLFPGDFFSPFLGEAPLGLLQASPEKTV